MTRADALAMRERAAKWHDDRLIPEKGPEWGLASDEQRRAIWQQNAHHEAAAKAIRALPLPDEPAPGADGWPEPKVTNPDIGQLTNIPYFDCLIDQLMDAQQDINCAANERMDQSLCDACALL